MLIDDLKPYIVQVGAGSGCLFNPSNTGDYSYILTAKHIFEGIKEDEDGNKEEYSVKEDEITIIRMVPNGDIWDEVEVPYILKKGETYFPHKTSDVAILKIDYLEGFNKIAAISIPDNISAYTLCGFPARLRAARAGNKNTSYSLSSIVGPAGDTSYTAQLTNGVLNKDDIEGMSGGAILYVNTVNELIYIAGIQSEMKHSAWPNGQINFVPIKYFGEIIEYAEYKDKLITLYPPYMHDFNFLQEDCFNLEVDAIDEHKIANVRMALRNMALKVTASDVTPIGIRKLFEHRLLIDEKHTELLSCKSIWLAWLEFLTIMNIIKYENINLSMLSEIFDSYRLKQSHKDDWTALFYYELPKSDYIGLKPGSTIVVNSPKPPRKTFLIPKGKIVDIVQVYDQSGFKTDQGIDPFTSFNFVHIDYFKSQCIVNRIDEYIGLDQAQLLEKLKLEYNELFN